MTKFTKAVSNFFLQEKGVDINSISYKEMPEEKEKYNLSKNIGNVNLTEGRFKIKSEANTIIDEFLSMSLP